MFAVLNVYVQQNFFILYKTARVSDQNAHKTFPHNVDNELHLTREMVAREINYNQKVLITDSDGVLTGTFPSVFK